MMHANDVVISHLVATRDIRGKLTLPEARLYSELMHFVFRWVRMILVFLEPLQKSSGRLFGSTLDWSLVRVTRRLFRVICMADRLLVSVQDTLARLL